MQVFRLVRGMYADDLSGYGAWLHGGRWNSPGTFMLYTSDSKPLALLEILVNTASRDLLAPPFSLLTLSLPNNQKLYGRLDTLSEGWAAFPYLAETIALGDDFVKMQTYLGLWVPSAIVPDASNLLLNPHHPAFEQVKPLSSILFPINERLAGN